jgi:hypothetical protein
LLRNLHSRQKCSNQQTERISDDSSPGDDILNGDLAMTSVVVLCACCVLSITALGKKQAQTVPGPQVNHFLSERLTITSITYGHVVEAETSGAKSMVNYRLECPSGAEYLDAGNSYEAAESVQPEDGSKWLWIYVVLDPNAKPPKPTSLGLSCQIRTEKVVSKKVMGKR